MRAADATVTSPKRILYCEGNVDGTIGGSFYSLLFLVEGLDRTRYRPVVVFHRDNELIPLFRATGAETHVFVLKPPFRFPEAWERVPGLGILLRIFQKGANFWRRFVGEGIRGARFLRQHRIDLVHLNNSITGNHNWMLGALLARIPCITHERGINDRYSRLTKFFAGRLHAIVCISEAVRQSLVRGAVKYRRAVVIHNGIDVSRVAPLVTSDAIRSRFSIPAAAPVIGIVGNLKEWKGQDVVVRACARLRQQRPTLRCLLVGDVAADDRYFETRVRTLVDELGVRENVVFTGYQKNAADCMNAMDVVIHASTLPEPFGRVLIEAMALAKPVVASRGGGVTEIVVEDVTGLTFAPRSDVELAQQLEKLLADPAKRASMGRNAYRRVCEEFDIRSNVKKSELLYQELFAAGSNPLLARQTG